MSRYYSIAPSQPDFATCSNFYGVDLDAGHCYLAAAQLPRASVPTNTYHIGGTGDYALPWSSITGNCEVAIEVAGPNPGDSINLPTNNLRAYLNYVIQACPDRSVGIGGFATWGLEQMITQVNRIEENPDAHQGPWPNQATFITFSVRSIRGPNQPGNYDPSIAQALFKGSHFKNPDGPGYAGPSTNPWFQIALKMKQNTQPGANRQTWWNVLTQPLDPDQMDYNCDASLGKPTEVDCDKLVYSELGPSSDSVSIGPGAPKTVTSGSCSLVVESTTPISITWGQVAAALGTLVEVCLTLGAAGIGGTAVWAQAQPQMQAQAQALAHELFPFDTSNLAGRASGGGAGISGLNALPSSVKITMCQGTNCKS